MVTHGFHSYHCRRWKHCRTVRFTVTTVAGGNIAGLFVSQLPLSQVETLQDCSFHSYHCHRWKHCRTVIFIPSYLPVLTFLHSLTSLSAMPFHIVIFSAFTYLNCYTRFLASSLLVRACPCWGHVMDNFPQHHIMSSVISSYCW